MQTILQPPYNPAQIEILKLFSQGLTEAQVEELRQLLITFRFKILDEHVEAAVHKKGLTKKEIDKASSEHRRTTYRSKKQATEHQNPA
ncbi:MAG: hypothetical protein HY842_08950 [Bacteroidetes bacterium]|nr:hypothetical protein [Bacteroidota bacterium]